MTEATQAPKVIVEQPAPCSDGAQAENVVRDMLVEARAPREGWTFVIRFARKDARLRVVGVIRDEEGEEVAQRSLEQESSECSALARAVTVWASLVLDAEVDRSAARVAATLPEGPRPVVPQAVPDEPRPWVPPRTRVGIEVGATGMVTIGTGAGTLAGPSVFVAFEPIRGLALRPSVALARTVAETPSVGGPIVATWGVARFDACGAFPGVSLGGHWIQAEACVGPEAGFVQFDTPAVALVPGSLAANVAGQAFPVFNVGAGAAIRGRLVGRIQASIRALAEVDVLRDGSLNPGIGPRSAGLFLGRGEVGLSWRFR